MGQHLEVLQQRKEAKRRRLEARKNHNSTVRRQDFRA
jgi:hypothetical protein